MGMMCVGDVVDFTTYGMGMAHCTSYGMGMAHCTSYGMGMGTLHITLMAVVQSSSSYTLS